jgi:hypothetical protein
MAIRPLNSVAGFSVGETPASIILANGDITTTNITTTGVSNLNSVGNVKITGGSGGQVLSTDGSGNLSFITIGTASLNNGTSNVTVFNSGNITFSVAGNANVGTFTGTGLNVAGYLNATGNANLGNLGTAQVLATANVTAPQLISNTSTGTAPLVVSSTTLVSNLNADLLDGYNTATANTANTVAVRDASGNLSANFFIGNGSQLTGLPSGTSIANGNSNISAGTANGNITVSIAGNANVVVFTGTGANIAGYANVTGNLEAGGVKTDNLYYANGTPWDLTQPAGSNTQIQYNDGAGGFGASANFTFDDAANLLTVSGTGAQVNIGANTFISNAHIVLGDPNFTSNAYMDIVQDSLYTEDGSGATYRFAGLGLQGGLQYSNGTFSSYMDEQGMFTSDSDAGSYVYAYSNGYLTTQTQNGSGLYSSNVTFTWLVQDGNGFTANAAGGYHTQKFQAPVIESNVATGTAPFIVTSTTQVANLNVATAGTAGSATTAGTVTTNAQPNITSVGTLTSLTATGNVAGGNLTTGGQVAATGNITGGNLITAGNVFAPAIISNGTYNTKIELGASSGIIAITSDGNSTQFGPSGTITLGGASQIQGGTFGGSGITLGTSQTDIFQNRGGNVTVQVGTGGTIANTWTFAQDGSFTSPGNITTTANANVGNLNTGGVVAATGNVSGGNITTGGVVAATGNVSGGNLTTGGVVAATGNVSGGNLTTAGVLSVTGNANVGNLGTGGLITATGNVSGGNLTTGGIVNATGNIVSGANVVTDLIVGKTSSVTITATGSNQNVNLVPTGTGTVNVGNFIISNVATPVASTDAATKQYVDDVAQGLHTHDSCNAATSTTLATSSGGTVTYNNGTSGVGATLTTTGSYTTIDGVTLSNGMRILVKDEANTAHNGIYDRTSSTVLTRSADFNTPTEMAGGDFTFVTAGTLYDNTGWVMPDPVTTVGTSPVVWVQFSGAGTYTAGTGLALNGNQFSIANTTVTAGSYGNGDYNATFTVNEQGQLSAAANVAITANAANLTGTTLASTIVNSSLTSVGTLGSLAVTGNATAGNVYANSGTIGASLLTGTLTTAAQPNVTSVGTLTSLTVTGTATAGNLSTGGTLSVTGNANVGNLGTGGLIVATGNVSGGNLTTGGVVAATGNVSGGNLTTAGALAVTGNASVGNLSATNGNLTTANVSGNIILGNASVTTAISWASATTTAITANQTIASFSATGVVGVEFIVKGIDSAGSKYSVATVQAVTDGTNVDYSTFGTVNLGGFTGSLAVNVVGGFVRLQVTPASSNSTVWTTQYRFI